MTADARLREGFRVFRDAVSWNTHRIRQTNGRHDPDGGCCAGARLAMRLGVKPGTHAFYLRGVDRWADTMGCTRAHATVLLQQAGAGHDPFSHRGWPSFPDEVAENLWAIEQVPSLVGPQLFGIDLSGVDLTGHDLSNANLESANLSQTNLSRANLTGAVLRGVWGTGANFSHANLTNADLTWAFVKHANLPGAVVAGARFHEADLEYANLMGVDFRKADLTGARLTGVDTAGALGVPT